MKINTLLFPLLVIGSLTSTLFATDAQTLFDTKCVSCHIKTPPADRSSLVAPPLMGIMRHVTMKYTTKDEVVAFITNYALYPNKNEAVCMQNTIARFGLMPSQKGNVTNEELKKIASWMYESFSPRNMQGNRSCGPNKSNRSCGTNKANKSCCANKTNRSQNKMMKRQKMMAQKQNASPFLIMSPNMPHLTSLVKMNWDNKALNLSDKQKQELLIVRKRTMKSVMDLKPRIMKLQKSIVMLTMKGEEVSSLDEMVNELAKLKAQASKTHIACIHDTKKILTAKQLQFLLKK